MRKIHLKNGDVWLWRVKNCWVTLRSPSDEKYLYYLTSFLGIDLDLERAAWKGYLPAVTPGYVKAFINNTILAGKKVTNWCYTNDKEELVFQIGRLYFAVKDHAIPDDGTVLDKLTRITNLVQKMYGKDKQD